MRANLESWGYPSESDEDYNTTEPQQEPDFDSEKELENEPDDDSEKDPERELELINPEAGEPVLKQVKTEMIPLEDTIEKIYQEQQEGLEQETINNPELEPERQPEIDLEKEVEMIDPEVEPFKDEQRNPESASPEQKSKLEPEQEPFKSEKNKPLKVKKAEPITDPVELENYKPSEHEHIIGTKLWRPELEPEKDPPQKKNPKKEQKTKPIKVKKLELITEEIGNQPEKEPLSESEHQPKQEPEEEVEIINPERDQSETEFIPLEEYLAQQQKNPEELPDIKSEERSVIKSDPDSKFVPEQDSDLVPKHQGDLKSTEISKERVKEKIEDKIQSQSETQQKKRKESLKSKLEFAAQEFLELQEGYRQETGKRPFYDKKETKGFKEWLEKYKKSMLENQELNKRKELREEWELLLENWLIEASSNEISKEIKEEILEIIRKYRKAEAIYLRVYQLVGRKESTNKEKDEIKNLLRKLEKLSRGHLEIFENLKAFRAFYYGNIKWYKSKIIDQREKFIKHLSQKLKNLKNVETSQEPVKKSWIEILKENLYKNTTLSLNEKSKINKILQKEELTDGDKKELLSILSKLPTEELISLFGDNFRIHTNNYIKWGWNFSIPIKRLILMEYFDLYTKKSITSIHNNLIQKLKHDFAFIFRKGNNPKSVTYKELSTVIEGLSLTQIKKLDKSIRILRYETYLEYFIFIKKAYERSFKGSFKWKEIEIIFNQLFKGASNNSRILPTKEEMNNFFFRNSEMLSWESWFGMSKEDFFTSSSLIINYWRRRLNKIAKILIEYCQKYNNIPFKAFILKSGKKQWQELKTLTTMEGIDLKNLEKSILKLYNINFKTDILSIRLLNRRYQFKHLLEKEVYYTEKFLDELIEKINNFIKNGLIKEKVEIFLQNKTKAIKFRNRISQYALSQLMSQNKEYIGSTIKSTLRYNKFYIIDYKSLKKLLDNITYIFRENSKIQKERELAEIEIKKLIMTYMKKNEKFYLAKTSHVFQSHPYINLEFFEIIFDENVELQKRIEAAYWLGLIFADGYITRKNEFGINLSIVDKSLLYKFCLAIGANPTYIRDIITTDKEGKEYYASVIRIFNSKFCEFLRSHGVVKRKSKILELPRPFQSLTENDENLKRVFMTFLLGYYDGDGITNKSALLSGSKKFLEQIQSVLKIAFKQNSQIYKYKTFRITFDAKFKQKIENNFNDSLARKRKYIKGKYDNDILGNRIIDLIYEYLNSIYIGDMIDIFNKIIEKTNIHKILQLSLPKLKNALTYHNISIHKLEWYSKRGLNSEIKKKQFKKSLLDIIEN